MNVPIVQKPIVVGEALVDQVKHRIPIDDVIVDEVHLRRSQRIRRPAISYDYIYIYKSMNMIFVMLLIQSLTKNQLVVLNLPFGMK